MINLYTVVFKGGDDTLRYDVDELIFFAFFVILLGLFLFYVVRTFVKRRQENKKIMSEFKNDVAETPITEINARVLKKECFVRTYGTKLPESKKEFFITFLTFSGETKRFSVDEDFYLSVDENIVGTIALIDEKFFDFYFEK